MRPPPGLDLGDRRDRDRLRRSAALGDPHESGPGVGGVRPVAERLLAGVLDLVYRPPTFSG
jgi:hypothetical protein